MLYENYDVFTILAKSPWNTYARAFPSAMLLINDMLLPAYPIQALWQRKLHNKKIVLTNDTISVVFDMYLVSHALCYTKIITYLQPSPKVLESPMHVPCPLQCCDEIAMLRGSNNIAKGKRRWEQREQNFPKCFKVFVWDCSLPEGEKVIGQRQNSI